MTYTRRLKNNPKMVNLKIIGILLLFIGGVVFGFFLGLILFSPEHPVSPSDYITPDQIHVYSDRVVINITNASWGGYANTKSMVPTLDRKANGIKVALQSEKDVHVGDLITYSKKESCGKNCTKEEFIIHRVIKIESDEEGIFFILKGDNNLISDDKIRFEDMKHKTVILIYGFLNLI